MKISLVTLAMASAATLLTGCASSGTASKQPQRPVSTSYINPAGLNQLDFARQSKADQKAWLGSAIAKTWQQTCQIRKFEEVGTKGDDIGSWLVRCEDDSLYTVIVPRKPTGTATVLGCGKPPENTAFSCSINKATT